MRSGFKQGQIARIALAKASVLTSLRDQFARGSHGLDATQQQPLFNDLADGTALSGSRLLESLMQCIVQGDCEACHHPILASH